MKVVDVREEAELSGLRPAWEGLLARSAADTLFLTWEWLTSWWSAYGRPGDLRILLAFDDGGALRGIAPLRRTTVRRYGRQYGALSFIGDGSADSDYLDLIIAAGDEAQVMKAFCEHWEADLQQGALLQLNGIPESSPSLPILRDLGARSGMVAAEEDVPCALVKLPGDWEEYLRVLAPRFRTKIRSVLRNLSVRAGVRMRFCEGPEGLGWLLPALFELHQRRWEAVSKPGVFRWDAKRRFYHTLSPLMLDRKWLRLSYLEWKGRVLACQYGFAYRNRYFQLQEGYHPDCEHWNPGIGLRAWSVQEMMQEGLCEYDFLAGLSRHKSDWGAETKLSKRVVVGLANAWNMLFCRGPEWEAKARRSLKAHAPARVLGLRDALQERRRAEQFARHNATPPAPAAFGPSIRTALAACYYHFRLPALLSPLRDRYQLCLSADGAAGKLAWQKRQDATVRILYFHRINDDGDPFFPSIPVALFEEQIRFVARHYRVVSLADAVRRLCDGGPAEPVVSITFDDGYQDNYLNAFPILRHYGVPATIFLTTGSIDSREPLWFEKLALALKKSRLPFVDLELDLPRRFALGTRAERLATNTQTYEFLRTLPDAERCAKLYAILAELGVTADPEQNDKMLLWDQIRFMQRHGIDFGGHTVTHPFLSRVSEQQACWEVSECKRRIEEELQTEVEYFAYPSGREQDFHPCHRAILQRAGYRAAASTLWGPNHSGTDRMELRRGQPWETHAPLFAAKFDWYQWVNG